MLHDILIVKWRINVYEAKAQFSKLIATVQETGEAYTICKHNRPVVDVVPHDEPTDPLKQDPKLKGAVFVGDSCAPLDDEDWPKEAR